MDATKQCISTHASVSTASFLTHEVHFCKLKTVRIFQACLSVNTGADAGFVKRGGRVSKFVKRGSRMADIAQKRAEFA